MRSFLGIVLGPAAILAYTASQASHKTVLQSGATPPVAEPTEPQTETEANDPEFHCEPFCKGIETCGVVYCQHCAECVGVKDANPSPSPDPGSLERIPSSSSDEEEVFDPELHHDDGGGAHIHSPPSPASA